MKELEKYRCPCCNQKDTVVPNTLCSVCIDISMSHHREVVNKGRKVISNHAILKQMFNQESET